jgi:2-phospho-L-lactate/phosphoenolpyruvate guanylyltransferase
MATIVVPFRGSTGKRRLEPAPDDIRESLALAMLEDVLEAATAVGETVVATSDGPAEDVAARLGARTVADPGGGHGAAVAAALSTLDGGPVVVVNADLPCVEPRDLLTLLGALPAGGIALVRGPDGTTNALALASPGLFAPHYGPRSERRFRDHAEELGVPVAVAEIPNLAEDVDTLDDLVRLEDRLRRRTRAALDTLPLIPTR